MPETVDPFARFFDDAFRGDDGTEIEWAHAQQAATGARIAALLHTDWHSFRAICGELRLRQRHVAPPLRLLVGHGVLRFTDARKFPGVGFYRQAESQSTKHRYRMTPADESDVGLHEVFAQLACAGSVVYFIRRDVDGLVKIGYSGRLKQRIQELRTAAGPIRLLLALPGGQALEMLLHEKFQRYRQSGEWFTPAPPLARFIAEASRRPGELPGEKSRVVASAHTAGYLAPQERATENGLAPHIV